VLKREGHTKKGGGGGAKGRRVRNFGKEMNKGGGDLPLTKKKREEISTAKFNIMQWGKKRDDERKET